MIRTLALIVGLALVGLTLATQGMAPPLPTELQVRQWAQDAARQAGWDGKQPGSSREAYRTIFRKLVKSILPDYDGSYVSVYDEAGNRGITIGVIGPVAAFESESADVFMRTHPLAFDAVTWMAGPAVFVDPHDAGAPDIVKVAVESDGADVAPLDVSRYATSWNAEKFYGDGTEPAVLVSEDGRFRASRAQWLDVGFSRATVSLHGGCIVFPSSAFAAGRSVKVTAISSSGRKHVRSLSAKDLRKLR